MVFSLEVYLVYSSFYVALAFIILILLIVAFFSVYVLKTTLKLIPLNKEKVIY